MINFNVKFLILIQYSLKLFNFLNSGIEMYK